MAVGDTEVGVDPRATKLPLGQIIGSAFRGGSNGNERPDAAHVRLVAALALRGHGIEALCFFLALARDALLDIVVRLDLPTPPDVPFRPRGGAHAWTQDDYRRLLQAWEGDWRCGAIAETLGRSKSSVWAKARRLGLPKRDRQALLQPTLIEPPRARQLDLFPRVSELDEEIWPPPPTVREWKARGTYEEVSVRRKSARDNEVVWDRALREHVAKRCWAGQRNWAIARDLGVTVRAITSMKCRMQIPRFVVSWLSDVFRPEKAAEHIAALNYVERPCFQNPDYTFWSRKGKRDQCKRDLWDRNRRGESLGFI